MDENNLKKLLEENLSTSLLHKHIVSKQQHNDAKIVVKTTPKRLQIASTKTCQIAKVSNDSSAQFCHFLLLFLVTSFYEEGLTSTKDDGPWDMFQRKGVP